MSDSTVCMLYRTEIICISIIFRTLKARGQVEQWLSNVESIMFDSVKAHLKKALSDHNNEEFIEWVLSQYGQISLMVILIVFTSDVENALRNTTPYEELSYLIDKIKSQLDALAESVKKRMSEHQRNIAVALIIAIVHARDIVNGLLDHSVTSADDFQWTRYIYLLNI